MYSLRGSQPFELVEFDPQGRLRLKPRKPLSERLAEDAARFILQGPPPSPILPNGPSVAAQEEHVSAQEELQSHGPGSNGPTSVMDPARDPLLLRQQVLEYLHIAEHEIHVMRDLVQWMAAEPESRHPGEPPFLAKFIHPTPWPKPPLSIARRLDNSAYAFRAKKQHLAAAAAALRTSADRLAHSLRAESQFFHHEAVPLRDLNWRLRHDADAGEGSRFGGGMYVDYGYDAFFGVDPLARVWILRANRDQVADQPKSAGIVSISDVLQLGTASTKPLRIRVKMVPSKLTLIKEAIAKAQRPLQPTEGNDEAATTSAPDVPLSEAEDLGSLSVTSPDQTFSHQPCSGHANAYPPTSSTRPSSAMDLDNLLVDDGSDMPTFDAGDEDTVTERPPPQKQQPSSSGSQVHPLLCEVQETYYHKVIFAQLCAQVERVPNVTLQENNTIVLSLGSVGDMLISLGPPRIIAPDPSEAEVEALLLCKRLDLARFADWVQFRAMSRDVQEAVERMLDRVRAAVPVRVRSSFVDDDRDADPDGFELVVAFPASVESDRSTLHITMQPPATLTVRVPSSGRHVVVADPPQLEQLVRQHMGHEIVKHVHQWVPCGTHVEVGWDPQLMVVVGDGICVTDFSPGWIERVVVQLQHQDAQLAPAPK